MLLSNKRLDGKQKKQFLEALDAAFTFEELEQMFSEILDKKITGIVMPTGLSFPEVLWKIIDKAERESWTALLLQTALISRPEDNQLITFAEQFGSVVITPPLKDISSLSSGFERIVTTAPMHEYDSFLQGLWEHGSQICRIDDNDNHVGTGFLVGPDLIMTCYHVWEGISSSDTFKCIFDSGTKSERSYQLAHKYKINGSKYSLEEELMNGKASTSNLLDYVLLQLNGKPGYEPVKRLFQEKHSQRGWITPTVQNHPFLPDSPLYILHYPSLLLSGKSQRSPVTLRLSLEEHAILESNEMSVKYKTNTVGGSSGSPCFNAKWELVAMHQMGGSTYNQGIPFAAIRKHAEQKHPGIFMPFGSQANSSTGSPGSQNSFENTPPDTEAPSQKQTSSRPKGSPRSTSSKKPDVFTPPPAKPETSPQKQEEAAVQIDRDYLLESLVNCSPGIFSKIVFNCKVPKSVFSDGDVSQTQRAIKVIEWAEVRGDKGLTSVHNCYLVAMDIKPEKKTPRNPR
jgi:hypothetical protein